MSEFVIRIRPDGSLEDAPLDPPEPPTHPGAPGTARAVVPSTDGSVTWVSVQGEPAQAEHELEAWGFHPLAVEDVRHAHTRAKFERYPGHGFALVPALNAATPEALDTLGIYVFVRPGIIVTSSRPGVAALDRARREVLAHPLRGGHAAERIVHAVIDGVADEYGELLYGLEEELDALVDPSTESDRRGRGHTRSLAARIRAIDERRSKILQLQRILLPFKEMTKRLADGEANGGPSEAALYFRDVLDHVVHMVEECGLLVAISAGRITTLEAELREETARANDRLNQVMKYMAAMSTLLLPMTIVSGAFGMNFDDIPFAEHPHGFWMATGTMLVAAIGLLVVFRAKRWL